MAQLCLFARPTEQEGEQQAREGDVAEPQGPHAKPIHRQEKQHLHNFFAFRDAPSTTIKMDATGACHNEQLTKTPTDM